MLTLAFVLALAGAPRPTARPAQPSPTPAPRARRLTITGVEPLNLKTGERVTVTGTGFDQGSVVLIGQFAPRIVERSDTRIVFVAPADPRQPEGYSLPAYLVTPGNAVAVLGDFVVLRPLPASGTPAAKAPAPVSTPGGPVALVDEKISLSASARKAYHLDMEVKPDKKEGPVLKWSSEGGKMRRAAQQKSLRGPDDPPLGPIAVSFSTAASEPVGCALRIGRTPLQGVVK